jgi:heptosyltransferase II
VKKILIIGPAWVGDMVMAQTLFQCLLQQDPDAEISVLAPVWCRELLTRMPEVKAALPLALAHGELGLSKRWRIARALAQQQFDQVIVLPNSFKSALIARFAGIAQRTGWRGEARGWLLNDCRQLDKQRYPLMVQRFAALAYAPNAVLPACLPQPRLRTDANAMTVTLNSLQLTLDKPVLALCPGAEFGPSKQWPAHYYADVAQHFLQHGMQVWLFGSAKDAAVAQTITTLAPAAINLCGSTTLGQAVDLLGAAAAVVSNDSGLMHVAAALARPLVVVYGSTSPAFTPPLAEQVAIVSEGLACSPCFKRECPLGHRNCLQQLPAAKVITAVERLLAPPLFLEH